MAGTSLSGEPVPSGSQVVTPVEPRDEVVTVNYGGRYLPSSNIVSKAKLSECSPYFRKLFNGNFKEGQTLETEVDGKYETVLEFFMWLATGYLWPRRNNPELWLIDIYAFADQYDVPNLRTDVFARIHNAYAYFPKSVPGFQSIFEISTRLPCSSPLYRFAIFLLATRQMPEADGDKDEVARSQVPSDFWEAVAIQQSRQQEHFNKESSRQGGFLIRHLPSMEFFDTRTEHPWMTTRDLDCDSACESDHEERHLEFRR